jgi:hypothetical protein
MKYQSNLFESKVDLQPKIYSVLKNYWESGDNSLWKEWSRILVWANDSGQDFPENKISLLEFDGEASIRTGDGKHRQATKLGRAIRQILLGVRPDLDLDQQGKEFGDFIQFLQGKLSSQNNLELVSGPQISKYYQKENTNSVEGSEISKSCMVGKSSSTFDIYTQNPDNISLLVRLDAGKASARALVWKLTEPSDCIYLDRIYSIINQDRELGQFITFLEGEFPGKKILYYGKSGLDTSKFRVQLKNSLFTKYPYLDSFDYLYLDFEKYEYSEGIIKNLKDFFKKKKKETSRLYKTVRALNKGFLTTSRNNELEQDRLVFRLRDHSSGLKTPQNSKTIDPVKHIYNVHLSTKDILELFNSGQKLSEGDLNSICQIVINSSYSPEQSDKILMSVLDRFIDEGYYFSFNRRLGDISSDNNLLLTIKKYKKWINFKFYISIERRLEFSGFFEKFIELFPEGLNKYLFFYLDVHSGYNIDKKHLAPIGGYTPYGEFSIWQYEFDIEYLFKIDNQRKDFYIELFFDDLMKLQVQAVTTYYAEKGDIKRLKLIVDSIKSLDNLHEFMWNFRFFDDMNIFEELRNSILDKCVKYLDEKKLYLTMEILDFLSRQIKYNKTLRRRLLDDLYSKGLDGKILNQYIIKKELQDKFKLYPEKTNLIRVSKDVRSRIKKFANYGD